MFTAGRQPKMNSKSEKRLTCSLIVFFHLNWTPSHLQAHMSGWWSTGAGKFQAGLNIEVVRLLMIELVP